MGGKERNPLCEVANCMEEENKINWFLCLCSASRNVFSLHPSGRTFGSYNSSCWCYDVQFCMSLNAAGPPLRYVSQEHSRTVFFPCSDCSAHRWHGAALLIRHKGSSCEVNKEIWQRTPAWCSASWKEQSSTALLTLSDIPITSAPLHHSLLACILPKVLGKSLCNNITAYEY